MVKMTYAIYSFLNRKEKTREKERGRRKERKNLQKHCEKSPAASRPARTVPLDVSAQTCEGATAHPWSPRLFFATRQSVPRITAPSMPRVSPGTRHGCPRHKGLRALLGGPAAGQHPAGPSVRGTAPGRGGAECWRPGAHRLQAPEPLAVPLGAATPHR